jgi:hypothetical protein
MTRTYQYDTPAGQLKLRQFKGGLWRLWEATTSWVRSRRLSRGSGTA